MSSEWKWFNADNGDEYLFTHQPYLSSNGCGRGGCGTRHGANRDLDEGPIFDEELVLNPNLAAATLLDIDIEPSNFSSCSPFNCSTKCSSRFVDVMASAALDEEVDEGPIFDEEPVLYEEAFDEEASDSTAFFSLDSVPDEQRHLDAVLDALLHRDAMSAVQLQPFAVLDAQHHFVGFDHSLDLGTGTTTPSLSIPYTSVVSGVSVFVPAGPATTLAASTAMPSSINNGTLANCLTKCVSSNTDMAAPVAAYGVVEGLVVDTTSVAAMPMVFINATIDSNIDIDVPLNCSVKCTDHELNVLLSTYALNAALTSSPSYIQLGVAIMSITLFSPVTSVQAMQFPSKKNGAVSRPAQWPSFYYYEGEEQPQLLLHRSATSYHESCFKLSRLVYQCNARVFPVFGHWAELMFSMFTNSKSQRVAQELNEHSEVARIFLSRGASIDIAYFHETPLNIVAACGKSSVMRVLLEHHAYPNKISEELGTLLVAPLYAQGITEPIIWSWVKLFVVEGADVNSNDPDILSVVAFAQGLTDCIKYYMSFLAKYIANAQCPQIIFSKQQKCGGLFELVWAKCLFIVLEYSTDIAIVGFVRTAHTQTHNRERAEQWVNEKCSGLPLLLESFVQFDPGPSVKQEVLLLQGTLIGGHKLEWGLFKKHLGCIDTGWIIRPWDPGIYSSTRVYGAYAWCCLGTSNVSSGR